MEPLDKWRTAHQMIEQHGVEAELQAALNADDFLERGDPDSFHGWKRIVDAIKDLQRESPDLGGAVH